MSNHAVSLEQLKAALDVTADAISVVDCESLLFVYNNDAVGRMRGIPREELEGKGPLYLGEYDTDELRSIYAEASAAYPAVTTREGWITARGGQRLRVETILRAFRSEGRTLIVVVQRDITARYAATQRLRLFREAMDHSADVLGLMDRESLAHLDINRRGLEWTGMTYEQYLALKPWEVAWKGATREQYTAKLDEAIARSPQPQVQTVLRVRSDGTEYPAEIIRSALQVDGRWIIASSVRDISERYAAHAAAERFRAALDASGDGMMLIDTEAGTVVDANDAASELLGLHGASLIGRSAVDAYACIADPPPQDRATEAHLLRDAARVEVSQLRRRLADGGVQVLERRRRAFLSGERWLVFDILRDVTQHANAQRELHARMEDLARSNQELERFAYVTSHDLSEPLRMVASYVQLLERRYGDKLDPDAREFIDFAVTGAQRMKRLIDDLLAYSRAGRQRELRMLCLREPVGDAVANLRHAIDASGATVEVVDALPTVLCDGLGMAQLFQNLIANAIKFRGAEPPVVRIRCRRGASGWIVSVDDNGIGIEPQYYARIFQLFQRLHSRETYDGTGIGLAICEKIVQSHGGEIWVESVPGKGASFSFRLPA